jgi:hypothetical protein
MHTASHESVTYHVPDARELRLLIRAEYREIPGLSVTLAQAARLWNADRAQCLAALEALTADGFLYRSGDVYHRSTCGRRSA